MQPTRRLSPKEKRVFSRYIVYVDESGDHNLVCADSTYPIFVLAFCIFEKSEYIAKVVPAVQDFKFRLFGHDMVVIHESDIRKAKGPFAFLTAASCREPFLAEMSKLIADANFTLIATAIHKDRLKQRYARAKNPYHIAMEFGLERVAKFLGARGDSGRCHVVVERRGKKEDEDLELEFLRICTGGNYSGKQFEMSVVFADKQVNSCGLQFADLIARPIGRHLINPSQPNHAFDVIKTKFDANASGNYEGYGLKAFP